MAQNKVQLEHPASHILEQLIRSLYRDEKLVLGFKEPLPAKLSQNKAPVPSQCCLEA